MEVILPIISLTLAFLIGAIPTAYIVGRRLKKVDLLAEGSSSSGTLNTFRQVGKGAAIGVLIVDVGKGALAVFIGMRLGVPDAVVYITAAMAVLGHNFSPFVGFRGGKGAATGFGASSVILWTVSLPAAGAGILIFALTRHATLAIATTILVLNILVIATLQPAAMIGSYIGISTIILGTHVLRRHGDLIPALRERQWRRAMTIE